LLINFIHTNRINSIVSNK